MLKGSRSNRKRSSKHVSVTSIVPDLGGKATTMGMAEAIAAALTVVKLVENNDN